MKKYLFSVLFLSLVITAVPALPVCFGSGAAEKTKNTGTPAHEAVIPDAELSSSELSSGVSGSSWAGIMA